MLFVGSGMHVTDGDEAYADVTAAMEDAFVAACRRRPDLTLEERFVALLLLKDRILERYLEPDLLAPELAGVARRLYRV